MLNSCLPACVPVQVQRLIGCMREAVVAASSQLPLCAVIHTNLLPGSCNGGGGGGAGGGTGPGLQAQARQEQERSGLPPTYFLLQTPVPHELLLPQCDLVVHHGGAGTTQAALLAGVWHGGMGGCGGMGGMGGLGGWEAPWREHGHGCSCVNSCPSLAASTAARCLALHAPLPAGKPSLVVPCVPSSDQPFWADLVHRRGLGPPWFPGAPLVPAHLHLCLPVRGGCTGAGAALPAPAASAPRCPNQPTQPGPALAAAPACLSCAVLRLTAAKLASGIQRGLLHLDRYTAAAEALGREMNREDGVAAAADIIEQCGGAAAAARQQRA